MALLALPGYQPRSHPGWPRTEPCTCVHSEGLGFFWPYSPHWASGLSGAETILHFQPLCPAEHPAYEMIA